MASASQQVTKKKEEDPGGHQFHYRAMGSIRAVELHDALLGVLRQRPAATGKTDGGMLGMYAHYRVVGNRTQTRTKERDQSTRGDKETHGHTTYHH